MRTPARGRIRTWAGSVAVLLAAAVGVAVFRGPALEQGERAAAQSRPVAAAAVQEDDAGVGEASPPSRRADEIARARQAELNGASPTFRNTTLLVAIRDAGYVCEDLIDARQSGDELAGWRVSCRDALAYSVAVDRSGNLVVDPMPHWEGAPPFAPGLLQEPIEIVPDPR
jgi:hypothetical protein